MPNPVPLLIALLALLAPPLTPTVTPSPAQNELWLVFTGLCAFKADDGKGMTVLLPLSNYPITINKSRVDEHHAYVRFAKAVLGEKSTRHGCQPTKSTNETYCKIVKEELTVTGPFEASPFQIDPSFDRVVQMKDIAAKSDVANRFLQAGSLPKDLAARLTMKTGILEVNTADVPAEDWQFGNKPARTLAHAAALRIKLTNSTDPVVLGSSDGTLISFLYPETGPLVIEIGQALEKELADPSSGMQVQKGDPDNHFLLHYQLLGSRKCNNLLCDDATETCADTSGDILCPAPVRLTPAAAAAKGVPTAKTVRVAPKIAFPGQVRVTSNRVGGSNCPPIRF